MAYSLLLLFPLGLQAIPLEQEEGVEFQRDVAGFLSRHCEECHHKDQPEGDFSIGGFQRLDFIRQNPEDWSYIRELVFFDEMPPTTRLRPPTPDRKAFLNWSEQHIGPPDWPMPEAGPGRPILRRLSRTEYRNTVRDLLGVDFPAAERFPPDASGHGFDNIGDAQHVTTPWFEGFLSAAEEIADQAVHLPPPKTPVTQSFAGPQLNPTGKGRPGNQDFVLFTNGGALVRVGAERSGTYTLRVTAWASRAGNELAKMAFVVNGRLLEEVEVSAPKSNPEVFDYTVKLDKGMHSIGAAFLNDAYHPKHADPNQRDRNLYLRQVELIGPIDTPPPSKFQTEIFASFPVRDREMSWIMLIRELGLRFWRSPPQADQVQRLFDFIREEESSPEARLKRLVVALLSSPRFLFRVEAVEHEGKIRALNNWELATRLSYFLWSTTPDELLLEAAAHSELTTSAGLKKQVRRLLKDPRSAALSQDFAAQWLQIRRLDNWVADPILYPEFDDNLRTAMARETELFFDAILREDRSVWDFLEGDFSFVNEPLAKLYGIPNIEGEEFQRVSLVALPRRGLLTQASIMAVTSNPSRTSPVKRGRWILEAMLGSPPPAPPPGGDSFVGEATADGLSMREQMKIHRSKQECATCHATMDPLGFSLENFGPLGNWRDQVDGFAVDSAGVLPDGRSFSGAIELSSLLSKDEAFLRNLVEQLLVYSLGRQLHRGDRPAVDTLILNLDLSSPTLTELIISIVGSDMFRNRQEEAA